MIFNEGVSTLLWAGENTTTRFPTIAQLKLAGETLYRTFEEKDLYTRTATSLKPLKPKP